MNHDTGCDRRGGHFDVRSGIVEGILGVGQRGLECSIHLAHGLKSFGGVLRGGFENDPLDGFRDVGTPQPRERNRLIDVLEHHGHGSLSLKRQFARTELEQNDPQRILIGGRAHLFAPRLLRRHIGRGSQQRRSGQANGRIMDAGQAEVGQERIPFLVEQDVRGLHIPMDNTLIMSEFQRAAQLLHQHAAFRGGQRSVA